MLSGSLVCLYLVDVGVDPWACTFWTAIIHLLYVYNTRCSIFSFHQLQAIVNYVLACIYINANLIACLFTAITQLKLEGCGGKYSDEYVGDLVSLTDLSTVCLFTAIINWRWRLNMWRNILQHVCCRCVYIQHLWTVSFVDI